MQVLCLDVIVHSLLDDNNDEDTIALNTEVDIDETTNITMTKISVITMNRLFIFLLFHDLRTNLLCTFVSFYLIQTIFTM